MQQRIGGGRVIDHGPASAIHSRGRVPGGVMVSQAIVPRLKLSGLGNGPTGTGGTLVPRRRVPMDEAAKARAKAKYASFVARHSDCECHILLSGQPRPIGYRERERDRAALRREMRLAAQR